MKRLARPDCHYSEDLRSLLTEGESRKYRVAISHACALARVYADRSPNLASLRTRTRRASTRRFLTGLYGRRIALDAIKKRILDGLDDAEAAKCQYCSVNAPDTFDHYLEKTSIPELAVFARNLIPCCATCNRDRPTAFDSMRRRRILHFYDDPIDAMPNVLTATLFVDPKVRVPVADFQVRPVRDRTVQVFARHFEALNLRERYRRASRPWLQEQKEFLGRRPISDRRLVAESSRRASVLEAIYGFNHYEAALFRAVTRSRETRDWLRS